jgi:trk system potassium uptake protein TrkA
MPVDHIVNPEEIITHDIKRLIDNPGALQVMDFAAGQVKLVGLKIDPDSPLVNRALKTIRQLLPKADTRVAAIFRNDRPIMPEGETVIAANDEVFFIAAAENIHEIMHELRRHELPNRRVVIAGGGHIGENLAQQLEARYGVRVIEQNRHRCFALSESLERSIILNGNASDRALLLEENIEDTDVFCAITNDDEANIMSSMLAKSLGARKVLTLINNPAYVDLIEGQDIDIAISPQLATLGAILTHIRRGDVVRVHPLRRGAAEAIEAIAHGDQNSSKVIGRTLGSIKLPPGTSVGALVRGDDVIIAHDDVMVEADDHFILFLVDKSRLKEVEALFQAPLSFF